MKEERERNKEAWEKVAGVSKKKFWVMKIQEKRIQERK